MIWIPTAEKEVAITNKEIVARTATCGLLLLCFLLCVAVLVARSESPRDDVRPAYNTSNLIRLHVVAPDNDGASSKLKLLVRDTILGETVPLLEDAVDAREAEARIRQNLSRIERKANEVVARTGSSYPVRISLSRTQFPSVSYGRTVLPEGKYMALSATIGPAAGSNWWCVLFPPLCIVDVAEGCILEARENGQTRTTVELTTRSHLSAASSTEKEIALYGTPRTPQRALRAQLNWELPPWICRILRLDYADRAKK